MLGDIVPTDVSVVEWVGAWKQALLHPLEQEFADRLAPKRRAEFEAGRQCARMSLALLGVTDFPLLPNASRAPNWPTGIVGSITHTNGYCAAAVSRASTAIGIGIDAERVSAVKRELWDIILTPSEIGKIVELNDRSQMTHAALIFSAKEAFFKAQQPITNTFIDFLEADVYIKNDEFVLECHKALCVDGHISGRYKLHNGTVFTSVVLRP